MASRICWNCGTKAHQTLRMEPLPVHEGMWMAAFQCDECGVLSIGKLVVPNAGSSHVKSYMTQQRTLVWLPEKALGKQYADVPKHIAAAASEAHACRSIQSYRAAVLMARAVIEATAKEQGIAKGSLADKIDTMYGQQLIREIVRDQAHEVRHLGNDMAHGDFVEPVSKEEADELLELLDEVLAEVYQAPAKLKARKDARLAKTQPGS